MSELRLATVQPFDAGAAAAATGAAPANAQLHDRIAEARPGRLDSKSMRDMQQRIEWICTQAEGEQVLDISCSQGTTAILLAREGRTVTSFELDAEAVDKARQLLDLELPQVQARVSFITVDEAVHPVGGKGFDSVVMCEQLEHSQHRERLVKIATDRLSAGQLLVVTAPFGIDESTDPHRTHYFVESLEGLSGAFDIADAVVLGNWLGVVAKRRTPRQGKKPVPDFSADLLRKLEAGFYAVEKSIRDDLAATRQRLHDANVKYRTVTEQVAGLKQRLAQEESARKASEQEVKGLMDRQQHAEKGLLSSDTLLQAQQAATRKANEQSGVFQSEAMALLAKLELANEKHRAATEQLGSLRQQLLLADSERLASEARTAELHAVARLNEVKLQHAVERSEEVLARFEHADDARNSAELALQELRVQLAVAQQQLSQGVARIAEVEKRSEQEHAERLNSELLARQANEQGSVSQGEARTLLGKLELANEKYRSATERFGELKQRLQLAESQRLASEARVAELQTAVRVGEVQQQHAAEQGEQLRARVEHSDEARKSAELAAQELRLHLALAEQQVSQGKARIASVEKRAEVEHSERLKTLGLLQLAQQTHQTLLGEVEAQAVRTAAERAAERETERAERARTAERAEEAERAAERATEWAAQRVAEMAAEMATERATERAAERAAAELRLDEANRAYQALSEQVRQLELALGEAQTARDAAAAAATRSDMLRRETDQALDAAKAAHEREIEERIEQISIAQADVATVRQQLRQLEQHLSGQQEEAIIERDGLLRRLREAESELKCATDGFDESQLTIAALNEAVAQRDTECAQAMQSAKSAESDSAHTHALLIDVNARFEAATHQIAELQQQLQTERQAVALAGKADADARQKITELHSDVERLQSLHAAADGAQRDASEAASRLSGELESLRTLQLSRGYDFERIKGEALRHRLALGDAHAHTERLRQRLHAAQEQVATTRATLSFQLGHALIFGFKSFAACRSLPGKLWAIRQQARQRRAAKEALLSPPKPVELIPPASSTGSAAAVVPNLLPGGIDKTQPHLPARASIDSTVKISAMLKSLKVAAIMDEFTHDSYRDECNLLQLTPSHWASELEEFQPELLFVESAWRGKADLWGNKVGHMSAEVVAIVEWCREHHVPTVFWNKEDPVHFTTFLSTAKLFDHVFTTDIDCIGRYKAALDHERVYLLPFAAQPALSNPIETYERKDAFCFAGAYYTKYPERTRDLGNFLATMSEFKPVEIYDRNFGKEDPNYKFPAEYQPFIVGNLPFEEIDKAYKGYRYGINLNSIKQSQSMFARRVFELLASNTLTLSNFSRGVRLLFGDLVITSDSGEDLVKRLRGVAGDEVVLRKFRLAALRKVMSEHTYQDRLAYAVGKVRHIAIGNLLPRIVVTAYAKNQPQVDALMANFRRQVHTDKHLTLVVPVGFEPQGLGAAGVNLVNVGGAEQMTLGDLGEAEDWLAVMVPDDHYGAHYLLDLAVATRYASAPVVGKATHYSWSAAGLKLNQDGRQYHRLAAVAARSGAARLEQVRAMGLREWIGRLYTCQFEHESALAIDEFNYCRNATAEGFGDIERAVVDDQAQFDTGMALKDLMARAERIAPDIRDPSGVPQLSGAELAALFRQIPANSQVAMTVRGTALQIDSALPDGKHEYWYATQDHTPEALGAKSGKLRVNLQATLGLNVQLVLFFLDAARQRITHVIIAANRNHETELPPATAFLRIGLRVYAGGAARITALLLDHLNQNPVELLTRGEHLLLTNHYPSHDDFYRNAFVHRRVAAYRQRGVRLDVFRLRAGEALAYHEFDDIDCVTGSPEVLRRVLAAGGHKTVLVHFLDEAMWEVLQQHVQRVKVVVWVHGAEIQPFHRREFNYATDEERASARLQSDRRMAFWRGLLKQMPPNLQLVFVSNQFAQEAMQDIGIQLPEGTWSVIHNPIDTQLFDYRPKPAEQRKKILSIRPYTSRTYANDLSVKAILALSAKPFFRDLEFRLIGNGPLFDDTLAPLRGFDNVIIERRFLSQSDIAQLHKSYGLFLCPTRMDTQGVSRDEAMSSGLVPLTNAVAAIPEFVDDSCGILAPAEDAQALAAGIERLFMDADAFMRMSAAASQRVRGQSDSSKVVATELALISA